VATYLRCAGVVNNQIKKGLLLSLSVIFFKSVNIWQSFKHERACLMHLVRLANKLLKDEESAQDNNVLACNFAKLIFINTDFLELHLTATLPRNLPVKKFENRFRFGRIMAMSLWPRFLAHPVYLFFNDLCQTNYLKISRQIFTVGRLYD